MKRDRRKATQSPAPTGNTRRLVVEAPSGDSERLFWLRLAGIGREGMLDSGWLRAGRGQPRLRLDGSVMELFDRDDSIWLAPIGLAAPVAVLRRVVLDAETLPAHEPLSINACAAATAGGTNGVSR